MIIRGAVLESTTAPAPFADSTPIVVRDLELDAPGPHELLVRIEAAGVCHSDLSVLNGTRARAVPLVLGHEAAGIVEEIGSDVVDVAVGDRVVMTFLPRCENCASCASGGRTPCQPGSVANAEGRLLDGARRVHDGDRELNHHLGVSGFATFAVVDQRSVVVVEPDVPAEVAALMGCAVLTGGGAVLNSGGLAAGETLIVVGLGGVGMAAALVGMSVDGARVIGIDANPGKLEQAASLGVPETMSPAEVVASGIRGDLVVEAVGRAAAFESAVALTAPGGRTVTVGLPAPGDNASVSPLALVAEGRTIIGSYLGSSVPRRDVPMFVDLWRCGRLPVERLISSIITLDDLNSAMDALARGDAIRQIILPTPESTASTRSTT